MDILKTMPKHTTKLSKHVHTMKKVSVTSGAGPRVVGAERGQWRLMIMIIIIIYTCATHRSRVPRRSSGRIKGGATTMQGERGPGLDFILCAAVVREGLSLYFCVCLFLWLNCWNVRRFPPPSSRSTNCVTVRKDEVRKEREEQRKAVFKIC